MKEIGGYIELDTYHLPMLHEAGIPLNCGRNCLAYLFHTRGISALRLPYFICDSVISVCLREGVRTSFYHIGEDFKPAENLELAENEWLYLVNFYGQLSNEEISGYVEKYGRVIVDQANAYFEEPLPGVDTLYTCRKWFGVADGAFLYTTAVSDQRYEQDESFERMRFLLGRYERTANEFYGEYAANNKLFAGEPIKRMSKLTLNLLHGIDYDWVKGRREDNFSCLDRALSQYNRLQVKLGTFMYPLMVEGGASIRKKLQEQKIYIPTLWPAVFEITSAEDLEYRMSENILPLPIDQRYTWEDMKAMADVIAALID